MYRFPLKDPDEILDYSLEFPIESGTGAPDTLTFCTVNILNNTTPPLVVTQTGVTDNVAYFYLSGGVEDTDYLLDITVDTSLGRKINGTYAIYVKSK